MRLGRALWPALLIGFAGTSCLEVDFGRTIELRRPLVAFERLVVGETDLTACLDQLGAPLLVRELQDGAALAWGWHRGSAWGLQASVPIGDQSANVSYQDNDAKISGLLLIFDRDWVLVSARTGYLRELTRSLARDRPALVEDGGSDGDEGGA